MNTYLCRWPNGVLSIVTAADDSAAAKELIADGVCPVEATEGRDGTVIPLPVGFRVHIALNSRGEFEFRGFGSDAKAVLDRLYPHLMDVASRGYKTKKEAERAAARAAAMECGKAE